MVKHLTHMVHNQRRIFSLTCNQRRLVKAVYNGEVIWEGVNNPRLSLEKTQVFLSMFNAWNDTNKVYTNVTFKVN